MIWKAVIVGLLAFAIFSRSARKLSICACVLAAICEARGAATIDASSAAASCALAGACAVVVAFGVCFGAAAGFSSFASS